MNPNQTIHAVVFRNSLISAAIALLLLGSVWMRMEYMEFKEESAALREQHISGLKISLKSQITGLVEYIDHMDRQTTQQVQSRIRQRVNEAYNIAWNIYLENQSSSSPETIRKMIKDTLRPIRFQNKRGYYFAFTFDGVDELAADRPELEGKSILDLRGGQGETVVKDMLEMMESQNEGFYEYTWTKPGASGNDHAKQAFIKLFEPYKWVLGTGEYFHDSVLDIKSEVKERIAAMRFGSSGYFFASTVTGEALFSNGKVTPNRGVNILELTAPNGVKIIQKQIETATQSEEGGFVFYSWNKIGETTASPKMSYVIYIPKWEWVIGAGAYLDTVEGVVAEKKADLKDEFIAKLKQLFVVFLLLFVGISLWARQIAGQIEKNSNAFNIFFKKAVSDAVYIDIDRLHYAEFQQIALAANAMIKERKFLQDSLIESEKRYRSMFQDSRSIMMLVDSSSKDIIDANPAACEFYGYSLETLRTMKISDINILSMEEITRQMERIKKNTKYHNVFQHRLASGEIRDVDVYSSPIVVGEKTALFSIIYDITQKKLVENALKNSENNLALVQKIASVGSWTWDVVRDENSWSDEALRICGMAKENHSVKYEFFLTMIHPDDLERIKKSMETALTTRENYSEEYRIIRPNGVIVNIFEQGIVVCDDNNTILKLQGTMQDVTEKKKLEAELLQAQKMEAIGTLAGGIAHDFNNILSAILGYSEIAKADLPKDSQAVENIGQVILAGKRAAKLVRQILAFSRKTDQKQQAIRIDIIVKEALKMLRSSLPVTVKMEEKISIETAMVLVNPTSVHQIVMNLCTNALHAIEDEKGTLSVELFQRHIAEEQMPEDLVGNAGSYVTLAVKDSGQGMTPKIVERIFDPYYTTKEIGRGTGLGLSVIHGIVAECNGFVEVDSIPGIGSTFFVNFPAMEDDEEAVTIDAPVEKPSLGNETILLVDDELLIVEMNTTMLERAGYVVVANTDSRTAFEQFKANPKAFDLVITDQTMPGMTGAEMAQAMIAIRSDIPIILCTGYSAVFSEEDAFRIGIKRYEQKPVSKNTLIAMVRDVLDA